MKIAGVLPPIVVIAWSATITCGGSSDDCAVLQTRWLQFVAQNNACVVDADCVLVGAGDGCASSVAYLGDPGGDAISKSASDAATPYLEAFLAPACAAFRSSHPAYDYPPVQPVLCEAGHCKVNMVNGCRPSADASRDIRDSGSETGAVDVPDTAPETSDLGDALTSQEAGASLSD